MDDAALLIQHVVGFKLFKLEGGALASEYIAQAWDSPAEVHAECRAADLPWRQYALPTRHESPHRDCRCGVHAWGTADRAWEKMSPGRVLAAVACRGVVIPHGDGFRAAVARVVALHDPLDRAGAVAAAERLGAAHCGTREALGEMAAAFGAPLPA